MVAETSPPSAKSTNKRKPLEEPDVLLDEATSMLEEGDLEGALVMFCDLARKYPTGLVFHLYFSAILHLLGRLDEARKVLETGVSIVPYSIILKEGTPRARVLRLRGIQNAYYTVGRGSKGYKMKLSGGGFSNAHMMSRDCFPTINYLVLGDNLLREKKLPAFEIIINSVADADVEPESLKTIGTFIRNNPGYPVINNPDRVLDTTRDNNYRRFHQLDGIIFPRTERLSSGDYAIEEIDSFLKEKGFRLPILVRETGTQTGKSFDMAHTTDEVQRRLKETGSGEYFLIQYVEARFRIKYFRKMRFFFVGGKLFPVVLHIDEIWNVHGSNRKEIMARNAWMMDEEKAFLADPEGYLGADIYQRIQGLYDIVGLDFFGIDFTVTEQGDVLIYELNPAMRHSFDHARNFPYMEPHLQNITDAFNDMVAGRALKPSP